MSPELASDLVVQTLRTTNVLLRESRRLFRELGVTEVQFNILNVLAQADAGLTQRELSDILVVDRSNVTGLLDRMESLGWIRRDEVPGDRRAWAVSLTAAGRRLWSKAYPLYERAMLTVVKSIGPERARTTLAVLRQLETAGTGLAARLGSA